MRFNLLKIIVFSLIITVLIVPNVSAVDITIPNPLGYETFTELINHIIGFLFKIALGVAPIMIVIGGFYFMTAGEDPARIATGKKIILYTLIGLLIVLMARGIADLIQEVLGVPGATGSAKVLGVLTKLTNWLFGLLLLVATSCIVIAGFYFVTSAGDPQKVAQARNFVLYTLVGVLVAALSKGLVALVKLVVK